MKIIVTEADRQPEDGVISTAQAAAIIAVHHPDKFVSFTPDTDAQRREFRQHVGHQHVEWVARPN